MCTAKRILEGLGIQTSSSLTRFDRAVFLNSKPFHFIFFFNLFTSHQIRVSGIYIVDIVDIVDIVAIFHSKITMC